MHCRSFQSTFPAPPAAPYPACSTLPAPPTQGTLSVPPTARCLLHPQHPTRSTHSALPAPPTSPCPLHTQHPTRSIRSTLLHLQHATPSTSETAGVLCSLHKSRWSAVSPCSRCFSRAWARVSSQEMFLKWEAWSAEMKQWWSLPKASYSGWMESCLEEQSPRREKSILVVSLGAPVRPFGEGQGQDCKGSCGVVLGQEMAWVPPTAVSTVLLPWPLLSPSLWTWLVMQGLKVSVMGNLMLCAKVSSCWYIMQCPLETLKVLPKRKKKIKWDLAKF